MAWNLHIVGHAAEDGIESVIPDFVNALKEAGHIVDSVVLTGDKGQKVLATVEDVAEVVDPASTPVIDAATKTVDEVEAETPGLIGKIETEAEDIVHSLTGK